MTWNENMKSKPCMFYMSDDVALCHCIPHPFLSHRLLQHAHGLHADQWTHILIIRALWFYGNLGSEGFKGLGFFRASEFWVRVQCSKVMGLQALWLNFELSR